MQKCLKSWRNLCLLLRKLFQSLIFQINQLSLQNLSPGWFRLLSQTTRPILLQSQIWCFVYRNTPRVAQVSQGGDGGVRGVGSSKDFDGEKGVVFEKVISTQIPTSIPMKSIVVSSTTVTSTTNVSKDPSKEFSIREGEGGFSNALVKTN